MTKSDEAFEEWNTEIQQINKGRYLREYFEGAGDGWDAALAWASERMECGHSRAYRNVINGSCAWCKIASEAREKALEDCETHFSTRRYSAAAMRDYRLREKKA